MRTRALLLVWPLKLTLINTDWFAGRPGCNRITTCFNPSIPGTSPTNSTGNCQTFKPLSCACAVTAELESIFVTNRLIRVWWSPVRLELIRFVMANGSRDIVGDSSAIATSIFGSVVITGAGTCGGVNRTLNTAPDPIDK